MKRTALLMVIAPLLHSVSSHAAVSIGTRTVTKLVLHDSNNAMVSLSGDPITQGSCTATNYVVLSYQQVLFREIYASLLAAALSNSEVILYVDGCITVNGSSYPKMTRIDVAL